MNRLEQYLSREISVEQAGFVKNRGCRDQIFNLRMIIEKAKEHGLPLYLCFIDYTKCFDSINHDHLWRTMIELGFPLHLIQLFNSLYSDQQATVRTNNGMTDWFEVKRGVRQGCPSSPSIFNIYGEMIMREALKNCEGKGIAIGGRKN